MYKLCFCSQKECRKCIFRQSRDTNFIFSPFAIHLRNTSWRHWIKQAVKKVNLWKGTAVEKSAWRKAWKCINYIKYINLMISLKIQYYQTLNQYSTKLQEKCVQLISGKCYSHVEKTKILKIKIQNYSLLVGMH